MSSARSASGRTRTRAAAVSPREAARLAIGHVFETLGVKRVTAYAAVDNTASRHVAEAVGFRQYGVERYGASIRDDWVDMALYDLTA